MTAYLPCRFLRAVVLAMGAMASSCDVSAAALDAIADAVIGKPDFAAPANPAPSASNLAGATATAESPVTGELWVADANAHRVLRFASARAFANGEAANLVLGQADFVSGQPNRAGALAANTLSRPSGVAVDVLGRLYVADTDNHRVLLFKPPYASGMDASLVAGQGDFVSGAPNRGLADPSNATLHAPRAVAIDGDGNAWVADLQNARVLRFTFPTAIVTEPRANRVVGQPNFVTRVSNLTASGLSRPASVTFDGFGNLWVADMDHHRVLRFDSGALNTSGGAANLVLCQPDFVSAGQGLTARGCNFPSGVAVDGAGRVFVTDAGNSRVLRFDAPTSGSDANAVIGQAGFVTGACNRGGAPSAQSLCNPSSASFDRRGNLLVSDVVNGRVLRLDIPAPRATSVIATLAPRTIAQGAGEVSVAVAGRAFQDDSVVLWDGFARPTRYLSPTRLVARLPASDFVATGVHEVTVRTGTLVSAPVIATVHAAAADDDEADRVLGQPDFDTLVAPNPTVGEERFGTANAATISVVVTDVVTDPRTGRLFVADAFQGRIASWPSAAAFQSAQRADLILGKPDEFTTGCNTGGTSARTLCGPRGIALDANGRLYVADSGNHRVLRYDPPFATGMAAARVLGQSGGFNTSGAGLAANRLALPQAVAVHGNRLFVGESLNRRVVVFENPDADDVADVAIGQPDFVTNTLQPASATRFEQPPAITVDADGRLYVVDAVNNRILRYSPPYATNMAADLVIGQPDFTSVGGSVSATTLSFPFDLHVDRIGQLWVADGGNNRVLRYRPPFANGMAADRVLGQVDMDSSTLVPGRRGLEIPQGIAVDASGSVYVATQRGSLVAFNRPFGALVATRPVNLSTRAGVLTGENVLIGGFIIGGDAPKTVVVRARGPSLAPLGVPNALANPMLQLFAGATPLDANDDWGSAANAAALQASGFAPADAQEAALLVTLAPGAYTAIVTGAGGTTGVGLVEVFEVDAPASPLVNIATRGLVQTGADVMIGGFVIQGDAPQTVVIRARGPSLAAAGIAHVLANPLLQLFSGAVQIATNDDWGLAANAAALEASGFAPGHPNEAAILVTLDPGAYTAIVTGAAGTTGVGIVEVFAVP